MNSQVYDMQYLSDNEKRVIDAMRQGAQIDVSFDTLDFNFDEQQALEKAQEFTDHLYKIDVPTIKYYTSENITDPVRVTAKWQRDK